MYVCVYEGERATSMGAGASAAFKIALITYSIVGIGSPTPCCKILAAKC